MRSCGSAASFTRKRVMTRSQQLVTVAIQHHHSNPSNTHSQQHTQKRAITDIEQDVLTMSKLASDDVQVFACSYTSARASARACLRVCGASAGVYVRVCVSLSACACACRSVRALVHLNVRVSQRVRVRACARQRAHVWHTRITCVRVREGEGVCECVWVSDCAHACACICVGVSVYMHLCSCAQTPTLRRLLECVHVSQHVMKTKVSSAQVHEKATCARETSTRNAHLRAPSSAP